MSRERPPITYGTYKKISTVRMWAAGIACAAAVPVVLLAVGKIIPDEPDASAPISEAAVEAGLPEPVIPEEADLQQGIATFVTDDNTCRVEASYLHTEAGYVFVMPVPDNSQAVTPFTPAEFERLCSQA